MLLLFFIHSSYHYTKLVGTQNLAFTLYSNDNNNQIIEVFVITKKVNQKRQEIELLAVN